MRHRRLDALVTAPVQKSTLLDAGIAFTGHTEFFAERTHTPRVVMMLVGGSDDAVLRVALVTTHLPLAAVPAAISRAAVQDTVRIVDESLRSQFGIARPRIAVCGLNPHAGEGGHLGREDADTIAPAIASCATAGIDVTGPLPADTVFVPQHASRFDAIVAMYHDQGLPVLKAASFGGGVVTLGLHSSGPRWTTAPRSTSRSIRSARRPRTPAAWSRRSTWPSLSRRGAAPDARMHGHQARRRFGQNFLADAHYVERIVAAIDPRPRTIVEIGPRLAALTGQLIARAGI